MFLVKYLSNATRFRRVTRTFVPMLTSRLRAAISVLLLLLLLPPLIPHHHHGERWCVGLHEATHRHTWQAHHAAGEAHHPCCEAWETFFLVKTAPRAAAAQQHTLPLHALMLPAVPPMLPAPTMKAAAAHSIYYYIGVWLRRTRPLRAPPVF